MAILVSMNTRPKLRIGDRIHRARHEAGMSQKQQLAQAVGVPNSKVSRWEAGHSEPSVDELKRIARATGVDLMWLLDADDGPTDYSVEHDAQLALFTYHASQSNYHERELAVA